MQVFLLVALCLDVTCTFSGLGLSHQLMTGPAEWHCSGEHLWGQEAILRAVITSLLPHLCTQEELLLLCVAPRFPPPLCHQVGTPLVPPLCPAHLHRKGSKEGIFL